MQKEIRNSSEKIRIETPYGTIESDSGNHLVDIGTIVLIIVVCALLKIKGAFLMKKMFKK